VKGVRLSPDHREGFVGGQLDFASRAGEPPENLQSLVHSLLDLRIELLVEYRAGDPEPQRGGLLPQRFGIVRYRCLYAVGVERIVTGDRLKQKGGVGYRADHRADVVQRP
jgi:hypothetical protein